MGFESFSSFVPKSARDYFSRMLSVSGTDADVQDWTGRKALLSIVVSVIVFFVLVFAFSSLVRFFDSLTLLVVSVLCAILAYFASLEFSKLLLFYKVEARARSVENVLPDFLLLTANNIRSGVTPFSAFRQSARPEFGVLSEEVKVAAAKSLGTQSFEKALRQLSESVDSRMLKDTVGLFAQSLRSGSQLAKLLENSALDLRKIQELRKELVTSVKTYVLFVAFVALIATPLLLAISIQFLSMLQGVQAGESVSGTVSQFSFLSPKIGIDAAFMQNLALLLLSGNALLAGLLLGVLNRGKARHGLKYFPLLLVASIAAFFIFQNFVIGFFSSFFIPA